MWNFNVGSVSVHFLYTNTYTLLYKSNDFIIMQKVSNELSSNISEQNSKTEPHISVYWYYTQHKSEPFGKSVMASN